MFKIWQPVFGYEEDYEVNILDGVVREKLKENGPDEVLLDNVAIEDCVGNSSVFQGYGVRLKNKDLTEQLVPIDKLVVEAILKKPILGKVYHKNGFLIDCSYRNLTLVCPAECAVPVTIDTAEEFYQYKRNSSPTVGDGLANYVFDRKYKSYAEFARFTGLSRKDFFEDTDQLDRVRIGKYLWSIKPLHPLQAEKAVESIIEPAQI